MKACRNGGHPLDARTARAGGEVCFDCATAKRLTFAELREGERFVFLWEQGDSRIAVKTGPHTYTSETHTGRVGVGDNPVRRADAPTE